MHRIKTRQHTRIYIRIVCQNINSDRTNYNILVQYETQLQSIHSSFGFQFRKRKRNKTIVIFHEEDYCKVRHTRGNKIAN